MALLLVQLMLTAAARDVLTSERKGVRHAILESDDANTTPMWVGDKTVTDANGIRLEDSLTIPGRMELGPFSGDAPLYTDEIFVAGTTGAIINALIVTH